MNSDKISTSAKNLFATPPSKKLVSPKSISRKPNIMSFTKKKPTQISEIRSSDRIRFISPSKANLFISQQTIQIENSIQFNYTQYSSNQQINYPFIKQCTSPRKADDSISRCFRKDSFGSQNQVKTPDSSFLSCLIEPSVQDFSNIDFGTNHNVTNPGKIQQQLAQLKKVNFQLNLLLDEKNELIDKQKQQYDARLNQLTSELIEIKEGISKSELKITESEDKLVYYQNKNKQLQNKLGETLQKLDKAQKEIKMYKAKYRINFNSNLKEESKNNRKYHQNCCKNHDHSNTNNMNPRPSISRQAPQRILKQSSKPNTYNQNQQTPLLKKIKSENVLPTFKDMTSLDASPQTSKLQKIHSNEEEFNEYIELRSHIQQLNKEIRYKDIEILTLKKTKCEFEKEKINYENVKKFNKKLLARVQFLTKECDQMEGNSSNKKRLSLPLEVTPKKKFVKQYEDFDQDSSDSDDGDEQVIELFELSPQKNFFQQNTDTDTIVEFRAQ